MSSQKNGDNSVLFVGDDDESLQEMFNKIDRSILTNYSRDRKHREVRLVDSDDITIDSEKEDKFYATPFEQYNLQKTIKKTKSSKEKIVVPLDDIDCTIPSYDDKYFEPPSFKTKSDNLVLQRVYEWMNYVRCDNNLLFFGIGSKVRSLNQLMYCLKEYDTNGLFVIVCGYNSEVSIGAILDEILKTVLKEKNIKNLSSVEKVDTIIRHMNQRNEHVKPISDDNEYGEFAEFMSDEPKQSHIKQHLYICIHNIDGSSLNSKSTQHLLSVLSSNRYIHLICSVDNQLSNLLWEPTIEDKFGFLRFNITNFCTYFYESEHYSLQDLYNDSETKGSKDEKAIGPVEIVSNILKSASKKHRQIYLIICNKFIENEKHNESTEGSSQPKPSGCTHQEIKTSMGVYSTDDALLRDALSYLENQIKVIKRKQNTYIPTLKRNQCEKLVVLLNKT